VLKLSSLLSPSLLSSQVNITTHGQSVSLSWCQAPVSDPRPISSFLELFSDGVWFNDVGRPL
jgi:hypothetical protein